MPSRPVPKIRTESPLPWRKAADLLTGAHQDAGGWPALLPPADRTRRLQHCFLSLCRRAWRQGWPREVLWRDGHPVAIALLEPAAGTEHLPDILRILIPTGPSLPPPLPSHARFMAECRPTEPHLYLAGLAVHPAYQRQGLAGELMARIDVLQRREGLRLAAHADNPAAAALYHRHGFTVMDSHHDGGLVTRAVVRPPE